MKPKMKKIDEWPLIESLFRQPNHLVKHHIDSYNEFITKSLGEIIELVNPMSIMHGYISETNTFKYEIVIRFVNNYLNKPLINENNGSTSPMFPNDARLRNLSYSSSLYVDIEVEVYSNPMTNRVKISSKKMTGICIGKIPIMVKSKYCLLSCNQSNPKTFDECKYDPGGYFIINGNEKVIVCQEQIAPNKTFVFSNSKSSSKYSHVAEIKSTKNAAHISKNLSIRFLSKENSYGRTIRINIPHVKVDVPILVVFRALGILKDKDILTFIYPDVENVPQYLQTWLKPTFEEGQVVLTQNDAILYLLKNSIILGQPKDIKLSESKKIELFKGMLRRDLLPHIGPSFEKKSLYLGYMISKLSKCYFSQISFDDRDSYANKRVDTSGYLMGVAFRQYFSKMIKDSRNAIMKELNSSPWKTDKGITNCINTTNLYKIFKGTTIESGLKYSLATGNWGQKSTTSKVGVAQVLNRLTFNSTYSHLRRVNTPTEKTGKLVPPRKLHNTQWGIVCPPETPEGGAIGLVKNLAMSCYITNQSSADYIYKILSKFITIFPEDKLLDILKEGITKFTKVFVNGNWVGICKKESIKLINKLRSMKRSGIINIYTSIYFNYLLNEINIFTDAGRCIRPLLIVDNNKLRIKKSDIDNLVKRKKNWENLLIGLLNGSEIEEGVIEYLDTEELSNFMIALNQSKLKTTKISYQYAEIHPSLILGALSSCIPFCHHNQSPRNTYQSAMGKQAMGINASNYLNRLDTMIHTLHYPNKPIVDTNIGRLLPSHDLPNGINVIVAIGSFTGYNQEDSVILNQSAIDRGLFVSTFYRTYRDDEKKIQASGQEQKFTNPDRSLTLGMKPGSYEKCESNGFPKINTYVDQNDIIIGKVVPIKSPSSGKIFRDSSTMLRQNENGFIDKIYINSNGDGHRFCKVRVRSVRTPNIGDKFSSRHGQKGTVGMIYRQEDMPFTKDGLVPDIIINPHAIPSRMTIAQLVECLLGKACCTLGGYGDGTPFGDISIDQIGDVLSKKCGFDRYGNEIMYSGLTGEQMDVSFFMGPTYYQRLKHMVKDKIHSRATGPKVLLTRQPPEGRSRDGGLRFGEMERDCMISHGATQFLKERTLDVSDNYRIFTCNKCNLVAFVNPDEGISKCKACNNYVDFSEYRIPYACKLMIQELESMAVAPRLM